MKRGAKNKKTLSEILDFFLVFFSGYFVYLLTLYPTVGTEDSGELIVSAAKLDIAHPPGYPLHTLLGKLFTILVPFGNIGWRVNLMSAFFGAATIALLYLVIKKLSKNGAFAIAISLMTAFSDIFWSQSIRTETYTLHAFFLMLVIWLLTLWYEREKPKYLWLTALALGLSLGNQHQMLLAGPAIFIFVLIKNWRVILNPKIVAGCLGLFFLGLSVYAYLPIRTALGPYDNPAYIRHDGLHTWDTFSAFVNRQIYGGTISLDPEETQAAKTSGIGSIVKITGDTIKNIAENNAKGFIPYMKVTFGQLLYVSLLLFPFGLFILWRKMRPMFWLLSLLFFFHSVIQLKFVGYSFDMIPYSEFSSRPFFIPLILITSVIAGTGFRQLLEFKKTRSLLAAGLPALLFLPMLPLAINFQSNNESHNYIAYDFNRHVLESLPRNAYLLSIGRDNHTFPLYYLMEIENMRPDVKLEIYYSKSSPTQSTLDQKKKENPARPIFIDLLPHHYDEIDLNIYNFVYESGDDPSIPTGDKRDYALRGIRPRMDYPNSKLKAYYYLKMALINSEDPQKINHFFAKVKNEVPFIEQFELFMNDYRGGLFDSGMF